MLRVHADRVHDAVRRLGVDAGTAVDVVEVSALALVDAVAERPEDVPDAVGWWFAAARRAARGAGADRPDLPLGGGVLSADDDQLVLAETLEGLPEDERLAVLLRDAYRLPWSSVAGALGLDEQGAARLTGQARRHAVPLLDDEPAPPLPAHAPTLGAVARRGARGRGAPGDAQAARHVAGCAACTDVRSAQQRVALLLSGLAVVALPPDAREPLLDHVGAEVARRLPPASALELTDQEWDDYDDQPRVLAPLLAVGGVLLAVLLGTGLGVVLSRGAGAVLPSSSGVLPAVTLPPVQPQAPAQVDAGLPPPPPVPAPRTSVFTLAPRSPSPAPVPTAAPSTTAAPTQAPAGPAPAAVQVEPRSGPNGATLRVTGAGWEPGSQVTLDYLDTTGRPTGSQTTATVQDDGRFTASLVAQDPSGTPGRHEVRATSGPLTRSAGYEASA